MPGGSRAQYSDGQIRRLASSRGRFESHSRYKVSDAFACVRLSPDAADVHGFAQDPYSCPAAREPSSSQ